MVNYTLLHTHTQFGNGAFIDSTASYKDYVDRAKSLGMKAIAITEHGNIFSWYKKKTYCEEVGLKYIHGIEAYCTETLDEKIRDNYHIVLLARNFEGFKELNKLSSKSYNRNETNRYYYNPRITLDEVINTSDNIIIMSACLGGPLNKGNSNVKKKFMKFMINNKHRCFLELQMHNVADQKEYNKLLLKLHKKMGVRLTVGTDTHVLDDLESRKILQKSKGINFSDEEEWILNFLDYNSIVAAFEKQGIVPREKYLEALENTNVIADMVEEFELDYSNKYPKIYDNPVKVLQKKVLEGLEYRGLKLEDYKDVINYEFTTYKKNKALQFILLDDLVKEHCRKNGIAYGPGRGSVTGSFLTYLLRITEVNPIQWGLSFERFMNTERISLADIDSDFEPNKRDQVKEFLFSQDRFNCCEIMTNNTIALKGAIRDVGRALEIDLATVGRICDNIESDENNFRAEYPELFRYVDKLNGCVVSVGSHPAGIVCFDGNIEELIGTFTTGKSKYPISQLNMKEIDAQNYVKLDILGLDNVQLINETCQAAGIDFLTPDNMDFDDDMVWDSIRKDTTLIFQMESNFSQQILKNVLSKEVLDKIGPDVNKIDLLSMVNGAIRPSGESYRDELMRGERRDNGHEALNEFLDATLGQLIFQEQISDFLTEFCGYTKAKSDLVRRGIAKKEGTKQLLPEIKSGFMNTMSEVYGLQPVEYEDLAESFLQVIDDASSYSFSKNHSHSYSMIGYACAWLRYHYPLEFLSSALNIYSDNNDKVKKIVEYMKSKGIEISPIKFGTSMSRYSANKNTGKINSSLLIVKGIKARTADDLYKLSQEETFDNFYDLLKRLNSMRSMNSTKIRTLIQIDYFSDYATIGKIERFIPIFEDLYGRSQFKKENIPENYLPYIVKHSKQTEKQYAKLDYDSVLTEIWNDLPDDDVSIDVKLKYEFENLGYIQSKHPKTHKNYGFIQDYQCKYKHPIITLYRLKTGETETVKVKKNKYDANPFIVGDTIKTIKIRDEGRWRMDGQGEWYQDKDDKEAILHEWSIVRN